MLEICIAVCIEMVVVNKILVLDLADNFYRDVLIRKLARVAEALHDCSMDLHKYYSNLTAGEERKPCFPCPTLVPSKSTASLIRPAFETFNLKLDGYMDRDTTEPCNKSNRTPGDIRRNLLLATYHGSRTQVVVKFTRSYNKEAHERLAKQAVAPKLYHCERVIGDMFVVVMAHVRGVPLDLCESLKVDAKKSVFECLKRAVEELKAGGFVHGDLRAPNVLVASGWKAKIVDFDWAAKDGVGLYPLTINIDDERIRCQWHGDVGPDKKMKFEHDHFGLYNVIVPRHLSGVST